MRWKFKLRFEPDWDFLFNCWGNTGIGIFTAGFISYVLDKPKSEVLIFCGLFNILLAWLGKSVNV